MFKSEQWRERLREAVEQTGKKHSFIAEQAGMSAAALSRILNGRVQPSFAAVVSITYATGRTVGSILEERGYHLSAEQRDRLREAAALIESVKGGSDEEA